RPGLIGLIVYCGASQRDRTARRARPCCYCIANYDDEEARRRGMEDGG
ncbi:hypothetical protein ACHAW5_006070, partial [Stephanodiscus triporus]